MELRKNLFNIIIYLLIFVLIGVAAICCVRWYNHSNERSETYGDMQQEDPYANFDVYNQDLSDIVFVSDGNIRSYEQTYDVQAAIDMTQKYNILINDSPCDTTTQTDYSLIGKYSLVVTDIDNNKVGSIEITFKIDIYVAKVKLAVSTTADDAMYSYLLRYIEVNGLELRIIEAQYIKSAVQYSLPIQLANIEVTNTQEAVADNAAIIPTINITYGGVALHEDVDYTATHYNNINPGMARTVITGKGKYVGKKSVSWSIWGEGKINVAQDIPFSYGTTYTHDYSSELPVVEVTSGRVVSKYLPTVSKIDLYRGFGTDNDCITLNNNSIDVTNSLGKFSLQDNVLNASSTMPSVRKLRIVNVYYTINDSSNVRSDSLPLAGMPSDKQILKDTDTPITFNLTNELSYEVTALGLVYNNEAPYCVGKISYNNSEITTYYASCDESFFFSIEDYYFIVTMHCFADDTLTVLISTDCTNIDILHNVQISVTQITQTQYN